MIYVVWLILGACPTQGIITGRLTAFDPILQLMAMMTIGSGVTNQQLIERQRQQRVNLDTQLINLHANMHLLIQGHTPTFSTVA